MANNTLFHIDVLIVDGKTIAFEDGTGTISGAARFENDVVPSASGADFQKRKRVPTFFKARIQFGAGITPESFSTLSEVQITARDSAGGRKALMPSCSFGSMGDLGGGAVDITFNVLTPIQWV